MKNLFVRGTFLVLAATLMSSCGKKLNKDNNNETGTSATPPSMESRASLAPEVINMEQLNDALSYLEGEWKSGDCRPVGDIDLAKSVVREFIDFNLASSENRSVSFREVGFKDDKCAEKNASSYYADSLSVLITKELSDVVKVKDSNDYRVYLMTTRGTLEGEGNGWLKTKSYLVAIPKKDFRTDDQKHFLLSYPQDSAKSLPDVLDPTNSVRFEPIK